MFLVKADIIVRKKRPHEGCCVNLLCRTGRSVVENNVNAGSADHAHNGFLRAKINTWKTRGKVSNERCKMHFLPIVAIL
jgi:hypothetical protein